MNLHALCYAAEPSREQVDPTIGLSDIRKGLHSILLGYLSLLGAFGGAAGVLCYIVFEINKTSSPWKAMEKVSALLFTTALLLCLAVGASLSLIVRGKWRCLMNAPEHFHAKWLMFLSIVCVLASPALNVGAALLGDSEQDGRAGAQKRTSAALLREFEEYKQGIPALGTRGAIKLAGNLAGLLSSVFFVLFLRAVALCWGARGRAFWAEAYLMCVAVLAAILVVVVRNPALALARPGLLLGLAAGWLICGMGYFGLILSTSAGINNILSRTSSVLSTGSASGPALTEQLPFTDFVHKF